MPKSEDAGFAGMTFIRLVASVLQKNDRLSFRPKESFLISARSKILHGVYIERREPVRNDTMVGLEAAKKIPVLVGEEEAILRPLPSYFVLDTKTGTRRPSSLCRKEENHRIPAKRRRKRGDKIELLPRAWYCTCPGGVVTSLPQPCLFGAGERHRNLRFTLATLLRS